MEIQTKNAPMKLIDRLKAMRGRHKALDLRIRDEMKRPKPDGLRVQTLKRLRLRTKDQISLIARSLGKGPDQPEAA